MISTGDKIPSVTIKQVTSEGAPEVDPAALFAGKKVVMFSLTGAYTIPCSQKHLPGYVESLPALKAQGVDLVVCLAVNDPFVLKAWATEHGAIDKLVMLSDGDALFTKALGIERPIPGFGVRAHRGLFIIDDGVVTSVEIEAPGKLEVSGADVCLLKLK
ncbi:MAG: peroxiredoxin [Proteobacteria bacterium]|nr:peroxiredoxin [Pseudomonadota bacterium]